MIRIGCTRIVLLKGKFAYKIARIRPIKVLLKILISLFSERHRLSLISKYDFCLCHALWKYLFAGLYANKSEAEYWFKTKDERCVPILNVYLKGLVLVQARADPVDINILKKSNLACLLIDKELSKSKQYGFYQGRCCIVDYAHWFF